MSPHGNNPSMRGGTLRGEQYTLSGRQQWWTSSRQRMGGIGIVTTSQEAPRGTSPDNTKLMLQALLAYRVGRTRHS